MKTVLALLASAATALALAVATPAAAGVPNGRGLEQVPFTMACPDLGGSFSLIGPPAVRAATGWTTTGRHFVATSFTFTITVRGPDPADPPFTALEASGEYGNRTGLGPASTCTGGISFTEGGFTTEVRLTMSVVFMPPT